VNLLSRALFLSILLTTPFTLHSTDIYHSSDGEVKIHASLNPNIISGDPKLGNTVLVVSAPTDMEGIRTITSCEHRESILHKKPMDTKRTIYVIQLHFPTMCDTPSVSIGDRERIFTDASLQLPIQSVTQLEDALINTRSAELLALMRMEPVPYVWSRSTISQKLEKLKILYIHLYTILQSDIASNILHDREDGKYISPVAGYSLPTKDNTVPGTGRPYRRDITDGIHHGWDIIAPFGTAVQALSKGKIIRIVNNWKWEDFKRFKRVDLSIDDRLQNLDIYRGNQVWLQSMDGNVVFYSHLSHISPDIIVGSSVNAGTYLGKIGTSGVPEKNYKNIHLHFEIQENPFLEDMKKPSYLDIMRWKYIGKDMNHEAIQRKTRELFQ
jgi:murein DD-endopeptidase MepM/ murein hydrolase activator NlpD